MTVINASSQFKTPLTLDEQLELIGALRSANIKILRYEKSVASLTLLIQELLDEPRNKDKKLVIVEIKKENDYGTNWNI